MFLKSLLSSLASFVEAFRAVIPSIGFSIVIVAVSNALLATPSIERDAVFQA